MSFYKTLTLDLTLVDLSYFGWFKIYFTLLLYLKFFIKFVRSYFVIVIIF
jgi:hypothetical protein